MAQPSAEAAGLLLRLSRDGPEMVTPTTLIHVAELLKAGVVHVYAGQDGELHVGVPTVRIGNVA